MTLPSGPGVGSATKQPQSSAQCCRQAGSGGSGNGTPCATSATGRPSHAAMSASVIPEPNAATGGGLKAASTGPERIRFDAWISWHCLACRSRNIVRL